MLSAACPETFHVCVPRKQPDEMNDKTCDSPVVKSQHKVPRKYLAAWCNADGELFTLRKGGKVFSCGVEGVEAENYFYQFKKLSIEELGDVFRCATTAVDGIMSVENVQVFLQDTAGSAFINNILSGKCSDRTEFESYMERACQIGAFSAEFSARAWNVWSRKNAGLELESNEVDRYVKNGGEMLMCKIENDAWPALNLAVDGLVEKINENGALKWHLAKYMVCQTMRGDKFVELFNKIFRRLLSGGGTGCIASYLRYFSAERVLRSLRQKMSEVSFRLIENTTEEEFLTGDNPVFRPASSQGGEFHLNEWAFCFPVSPRRALLLMENGAESKYARFLKPSSNEVVELNRFLCDSCVSQIHATHSAILEKDVYKQRFVCNK